MNLKKQFTYLKKHLYNEPCGLFAPIRIISAVFIERSYLFSLVLAFYTLASGKGCFKVLFHTMFVNVYHHFLWCGCLAHVVRMVNTTCAEGALPYDIRMTGDELWAKRCNTKIKQEMCRSLFSSTPFIFVDYSVFFCSAIKPLNTGTLAREKLFTHMIRYRTRKITHLMRSTCNASIYLTGLWNWEIRRKKELWFLRHNSFFLFIFVFDDDY